MKRLIVSIIGFAFCIGCFAGSRNKVKTEQDDWLEDQNAILVDQLADSDGMWLVDQTEILLEQLESQLESIDNG